jgi:excisionase family DNA binding protein
VLSPSDISERTQLGYRTVLRAIEDGELPASKLRGKLRVREDDFESWLDKNRVVPWTPGL